MKTMKQKDLENKTRANDFIEAVAEFLTTDVARKSIELGEGFRKPDAVCWAKIAGSINLGYASKEEAIVAIKRILFVG